MNFRSPQLPDICTASMLLIIIFKINLRHITVQYCIFSLGLGKFCWIPAFLWSALLFWWIWKCLKKGVVLKNPSTLQNARVLKTQIHPRRLFATPNLIRYKKKSILLYSSQLKIVREQALQRFMFLIKGMDTLFQKKKNSIGQNSSA